MQIRQKAHIVSIVTDRIQNELEVQHNEPSEWQLLYIVRPQTIEDGLSNDIFRAAGPGQPDKVNSNGSLWQTIITTKH